MALPWCFGGALRSGALCRGALRGFSTAPEFVTMQVHNKDAWRLLSGVVGVASVGVGLNQYIMAARFLGLESHLNGLESHLKGLESHLKGLESHLKGLESTVDARTSGLEAKMDARTSGLEAKMDALTLLLTDIRRELQELRSTKK